MNANRAIVLLFSVLLVAGLAIAFHQARAARHLRPMLVVALNGESSLRRQVGQWEQRRQQLAAAALKSQEDLARKKLLLSRLRTETAVMASQLRPTPVLEAGIDRLDRPFFLKLGLSAGQIGQAEMFIAEYRQGMIDLALAAAREGISWSDAGLDDLRQAELDQFSSRMGPLLGADGLVQYQQFGRVEPAGAVVNEFAGIAFHSGSPISAAQGEQLTQVIAGASPDFQSGGQVDPNNVDWDAVQARVQSVFSPPQLAAWQMASADLQNRRQLRQLTSALRAPSH